MADVLSLLFVAIQTLVVCITAGFAWISIRKVRDSSGMNFVIQAESTSDPLHHSLVGAPPELLRNIFSHYDLSTLTDLDVQAFPYMESRYALVSRICFLICDSSIDLGLSPAARDELLSLWLRNLALYRDHPAMAIVHERSQANKDFNEEFLTRAAQVM